MHLVSPSCVNVIWFLLRWMSTPLLQCLLYVILHPQFLSEQWSHQFLFHNNHRCKYHWHILLQSGWNREIDISLGRGESLLDQTLSEIFVTILWWLAKPKESSLEAKYFHAIYCFESAWLMDVYFFIRRNATMYECSHCITLNWMKAQLCSKHHDNSYCGPLHNWCPGFKEVNALLLTATTSTEACFELLHRTIRKLLDLEGPCAREDIYVWKMRNKVPALEFVHQGM